MNVIVVGGGLTGLLCALRLSQQGASVRLIEQAKELGGRARSPALGGRPVNLGPHALYLGGPAAKLFETLGLELRGHPPHIGRTYGVRGGELLRLPTSGAAFIASTAFTFGERVRLGAWLLGAGKEPLGELTTPQWLAQSLSTPLELDFAHMMLRLTTYAAMFDALPARINANQMRVGIAGVRYLDNGWQRLAEQLEARLTSAQVKMTHASVEAVSPGEVRAGSERWAADAVVLAVPPERVETVLPGFSAGPLLPSRAAVLDLVLERLPKPDVLIALGLGEPLYASVHAADERGVILQVAAYLRPDERGADWLPQLEAHAEVMQPGFRALERDRRFLPEMVVQHHLPTGALREVEVLPGVYLAGDWLGDGFLLDGAVSSIERVTSAMLSRGSARLAG